MKVYRIHGKISSFWNGTTTDYESSLYKTKQRAETEIPKLNETYSSKNGYKAEFKVYGVDIIE